MGHPATIPQAETVDSESLRKSALTLVAPPVTTAQGHQCKLETRKLAMKRAIDVFLASLAVIALFPVFAGVAAAIKVDSRGPVLYASPRVGRKGAVFTCYKFRSMRPDADFFKPKLRLRNERTGAFFKVHDDPRITRVGRWLRRYSLDELPQLWNVLRGEMSLVGPRPHPVDDVARYDVEDRRRLDCTPGITGLWQVTARKDPSFKRCVLLDLEYINRWSLRLDFQILAKTVSAVFTGSGE